MQNRFISFVLCLGICLIMVACTPGVYVKMDSTSPERTPVFIGMKRHEAELHLGTPIFITPLDGERYKGIYEYQVGSTAADMICYDIMDFTTLGLGHLIVTPYDRSKGRRHLVAVVYQMDGKSMINDRVVDIKEQVKISMK